MDLVSHPRHGLQELGWEGTLEGSLLAFQTGLLLASPRRGRVGEGALEGSLLAFQTGLLLASPASGEGWEGALEGSLATRLSKRASYSPPPRRGRVGEGAWKAYSLLAFPNGPLTRSWCGFVRPR